MSRARRIFLVRRPKSPKPFDVACERSQTDFQKISPGVYEVEFEIAVRNHKKEPVTVRVVEHLYRWSEWKVTASSAKYEKTDARTLEFRPTIPPDGESKITYTVRYSW